MAKIRHRHPKASSNQRAVCVAVFGRPRLVAATECAPVTATAAAALGNAALEGILVCHGSGDLGATTVGALGAGCSAPAGGTYCYLGTSGWVATMRPQGDLTACRAFKVLAAHPGSAEPPRRGLASH